MNQETFIMPYHKIVLVIVFLTITTCMLLLYRSKTSTNYLTYAQSVLSNFLQQPADTITCKQLRKDSEIAVIHCSHGTTSYIIKFFQNTATGTHEAAWTQLADQLKIGPQVYYADPTGAYFIMEFIEGKPLTSSAINPTILQAIAKDIALLHGAAAPFAHTADIFTQIKTKYNRLHTSGPLQKLLAHKLEYIGTLKEKTYSPSIPLAPCHNDLNPGNIFVHNDHVTIIDFGDASIGNPYYDIAIFFALNALTPEQENIFLTHYNATLSEPILLDPQLKTYIAMLKQIVKFEFALNVLLGVQAAQKDLLSGAQLPQTKPLSQYLAVLAEPTITADASLSGANLYNMAIAALREV